MLIQTTSESTQTSTRPLSSKRITKMGTTLSTPYNNGMGKARSIRLQAGETTASLSNSVETPYSHT